MSSILEMQNIAHDYRSRKLVVGLCHGCFDIVHLGHIYHLQRARALVDRLIVSITADEYVDKGPGRPIFSDCKRAEFMAAIRYCDHAIVSRSATAEQMIAALLPHVFFKGADYSAGEDPRLQAERMLIESTGGRIVLTDGEVMDSTTRLAQLITFKGK